MKYKILIVEDEFPILHSLARELSTEYEVLEAPNGTTGLSVALESHPDLILLDILLPYISGEDLLAQLRQDEWGKNATVFIITNVSEQQIEDRIRKLGITEYLIKSDISMKDLSTKIKYTLSKVKNSTSK
jgi:DNA-binding response OmpR family regulator